MAASRRFLKRNDRGPVDKLPVASVTRLDLRNTALQPRTRRPLQLRPVAISTDRPCLRDRTIQSAGCGSDVGPCAPVDRECWECECVSVLCEPVEIGVCCRMACLSGVSEQGGGGAEQHEGIQRAVPGEFVQVPRAQHLRLQNGAKPLPVELAEHAVIENPGCMHHPAQRRTGLVDHRGQRRAVAHIRQPDHDRTAPGARTRVRSRCTADSDASDRCRPTSTTSNTPRSSSQPATARPSPPRPPVINHVPR